MSSPAIQAFSRDATTWAELTRLRRALSAAGQAVYEWDVASDRLEWTGSLAGLGLSDDAMPLSGRAFADRIAPEAAESRAGILDQAGLEGRPFSLEYRFASGPSSAIWVEECGRAYSLPDGSRRVVGTIRAITDRKKREARLLYMACYDEVTGHLTRTRLREALSEAIAHANREGRPAAYLLAGVDNLDMVNHAYGFDVADEVVVRVAQRIERCLPGALVGRFSGNKFGIVLPRLEIGPEEVAELAARITAAVRESVIETQSGPVAATVSVGCVPLPSAARTSRLAIRFAQEALERARSGGGDAVAVYQPTPEQDLARRRDVSMARDVVSALNESRLVLAYQPIVEADSGRAIEYECLLRMRQGQGELLPAGQFIPTVEKLGLVRMVDRRALELAIGALGRYPAARLSLNVSAFSATDPNWLSALLDLVRDRPEIASRLTVEITETMAIQDLDESARFVATLRELGCRVALDDFGAGYTSFRHLKSLAVDTVKIDGSFVRGLPDNPDNQLFVRTLVALARNFRMTTVAESVGSAAEAELLKSFGVELFQGFFFGRPDVAPPWSAD